MHQVCSVRVLRKMMIYGIRIQKEPNTEVKGLEEMLKLKHLLPAKTVTNLGIQ